MIEHRALLRPDCVRTVEHPFGWVPCRMLTNGIIASMSPDERQLYLFLALAADRRGISFYGDKRIRRTLGCTQEELRRARAALMARDLLAYDGTTYQLLPLPPDATCMAMTSPVPSQQSKMAPNPAMRTKPPTLHTTRPTDQRQRQNMPESVREILRQLFGRESF